MRGLLAHAAGDRFEVLYLVALSAGMRQGELLGLGWSEVDFDAATVTVRRALQRVGGVLQLVEPKTERSRRTIALTPSAVRALRRHKAEQAKLRLKAGKEWGGPGGAWTGVDLVFTSARGTPLDSRNVTKSLQATLASAGLPRVRFHDLRHSCASLLLAQGVHARAIMEILGHSHISTTMDIYAHLVPETRREAALSMEAALGGGSRAGGA